MTKTDDGTTDFTCPACGRDYGDPLYHGPQPHAPATICFDCWADEWEAICCRHRIGRDPGELDQALWLISRGVSKTKAADLIHVHRQTLWRWLQRLRKYPHTIPEWCLPTLDPPRKARE